MKHRYASKSALFLMELLIAILVFAFTAAICMRIFVYAKQTADSAGDISIAVMSSQNAAECYKAYYGDLELTVKALGHENSITDGYVEYQINDNLILKMVPNENSPDNKCDIIVLNISGDVIYQLSVAAFVPGVN